MEHDAHLREDVDQAGSGAKIIVAILIVVALLAAGAYVVYGSGLWQPPSQTSAL